MRGRRRRRWRSGVSQVLRCGACFFFQAEDGIRDGRVTGVQTCALPISGGNPSKRTGRNEKAMLRFRTGYLPALPSYLPDIVFALSVREYCTLRASEQPSHRSEERRVGKECRARRSPSHHKRKVKVNVSL